MITRTAARWLLGCVWVPVLLFGCGRVPGQFYIVTNQVPEDGCKIPADLGGVYRGRGTLDVRLVNEASSNAYLLFPLLENDTDAPASGQLSDPNRIALSGFDVDIALATPDFAPIGIRNFFHDEAGKSGATLLHYQVPWSGSVASGRGRTAASVPAFPAELAVSMRNFGELVEGQRVDVLLKVRARGSRLNGAVESDQFTYPVSVCDGCLVASLQPCPVNGIGVNKGNACNVAQDDAVDCCSIGTELFCPPLVAAP